MAFCIFNLAHSIFRRGTDAVKLTTNPRDHSVLRDDPGVL